MQKSRKNLANQRALVTLQTLTYLVAESPKFPAPLVMTRAHNALLWSALETLESEKLKYLQSLSTSGLFLCQNILLVYNSNF